ncbi:selenide, water dikinase SelD [soil metagenome]
MNSSSDPAVLVGLDSPDDAGVYQVSEEVALVQTVDFFTPIVDDPFSWGRIAAANALSDLYAMGAEPKTALNLISWPRTLGFELLGRVLDGAGQACEEAGVTIIGGHSIDDPEPKFGMAATGFVHPQRIVRKKGAVAGAELVLTKALGTGIISSGVKEGVTEAEHEAEAVRTMGRLNRAACDAMLVVPVLAATDVTGFGLIGHLSQMMGDDLSAELVLERIPVLPGAVELARRGVLPGGTVRNYEAGRAQVDASGVDEARRWLLFDAQTSGGLLMAVVPELLERLLAALESRGEQGAHIGTVRPRRDGTVVTVV